MRIRMDCPAGIVTSPPGPTLGAPGAGAGAGAPGESQRYDVIRAESLHFAVHFKTKNGCRAAKISALHHFAAFQFQSIRGGHADEEQCHCEGSEKTLHVTHTFLSQCRFTISCEPYVPPTGRHSTILLHWIQGGMEWLREKSLAVIR